MTLELVPTLIAFLVCIILALFLGYTHGLEVGRESAQREEKEWLKSFLDLTYDLDLEEMKLIKKRIDS